MDWYYFNTSGSIVSVPQEVAEQMMERMPVQWMSETTEWGKLYYGEYDWLGEVVDGEYVTFPPRLKNGTRIPENKVASEFFHDDLMGDCFLFPIAGKRADISAKISSASVDHAFSL